MVTIFIFLQGGYGSVFCERGLRGGSILSCVEIFRFQLSRCKWCNICCFNQSKAFKIFYPIKENKEIRSCEKYIVQKLIILQVCTDASENQIKEGLVTLYNHGNYLEDTIRVGCLHHAAWLLQLSLIYLKDDTDPAFFLSVVSLSV